MKTEHTKKNSSFLKTWDILSPMVYYYLIYNIAFILLAFTVNAVMGLNADVDAKSGIIGNSDTLNAIIGALAKCLGVLPLLPMLRSQLRRNKVIDRHGQSNAASYVLTTVMSFSFSIGLNIFIILTGLIGSSESYQEVAQRQYGVAFGLGLILYGIVAPLVEEVIFRGLIYNRLKKYYPVVLSAVVSAFLFGAFHGNLIQALYGTCMGILMAYVYERFKDFKLPCLFHAVANTAVYTITSKESLYNAVIRPYNCVILLAAAAFTVIWTEKRHKTQD